jgi:rod shape determining protein RodA
MKRTLLAEVRHFWHYFKMDTLLFLILMGTSAFGLLMLYSASESMHLIYKQILHFVLAIGVMLVIAQIPPYLLRRYSPYFMLFGIFFEINIGKSFGGNVFSLRIEAMAIGIMIFINSEGWKRIKPKSSHR